MPKKRNYSIDILGSAPAVRVTVNGKEAAYSYDGTELKLSISLPDSNCKRAYTVKVTYDSNQPEINDGLYGKFKRMKKSFVEMRYRNASIDYIEELGDMETTGRAVTYDNSSFADRINDFRKNYDSLPELLKKQKLNENDIRWFLQSIHWQKN